jgi:hypothetical protein
VCSKSKFRYVDRLIGTARSTYESLTAGIAASIALLLEPNEMRPGYRTPQHSEWVPRRAVGELEVAEIGSKPQTDT